MRLNRKLLRILSTAIMLILGFFFLYPLLWMLSSSLKLPAAVFEYPMRWIPETLRFSNYATVWSHPGAPFYLFYINSIMVAFGSIAGTLVLCSTAAYAFARINFKGKNAVFLLLMSTMMIPKQVTLIPRFAMFNAMGLFNTLWALILPSTFYVVGIFLLRQFYRSIPVALSEAAMIDGATHARVFTQIMLPLTKSAVASLVILKFVMSWNEYMDPLIFLTSIQKYTIPMGMQIFLDSEGQQLQLVMAAAAISIIPIVALFVLLQKQFIRGIATSGIKG